MLIHFAVVVTSCYIKPWPANYQLRFDLCRCLELLLSLEEHSGKPISQHLQRQDTNDNAKSSTDSVKLGFNRDLLRRHEG